MYNTYALYFVIGFPYMIENRKFLKPDGFYAFGKINTVGLSPETVGVQVIYVVLFKVRHQF